MSNSVYFGIVEDTNDPKKQGRLKVRVQNFFDNIPLEHIPWASPYIIPNGKAFNIPPLGKIVSITFDNNSIYSPYYFYTEKYNINLQDKLESLSVDEYNNFNAILFDHRTQIYSESEKLTLDFKLNKITIDNESINLEAKDNAQRINLGCKSADQRVILGDIFLMDWFKEFVNLMINPANMNAMGSPVLKPNIDLHLMKFLQNPSAFLSSNVYVPNNSGIDTLERPTITSEVEHDDLGIVSPNEDFGIPKANNGANGTNGASNATTQDSGQGTATDKQLNTSTNLKELSVEVKNVEESSTISDDAKKNIKTKQEKEKSDIEKSKPKLILKIPKPFMDGYIIIKLGPLFKKLGGLALAALAALLLIKLLSKFSKKLPMTPKTFTPNPSEIISDLNSIDINKIVIGKKIEPLEISQDTNKSGNVDNTGNSNYNTNGNTNSNTGVKQNNKKANKKSSFSSENRGRTDVLESEEAKKRKPNNKPPSNNPNYGSYI
jgi:hypothetical protein